MRTRFILIFISAAVFVNACSRADVPPIETVATREVRDDLGRTLQVPEKIERSISLAPSLTEMIFAIGAGDKLVGVTTYCDYPEAATKIEKVGDTQTPNIEKIIALKPQVVFVSTASQLEAFSRTLDEQGIAVYVTNTKTLNDVFGTIKRLGEILGTSETARKLVVDLEGRTSIVRNPVNDTSLTRHGPLAPRVFVQFSKDPLFTIGKDSFLTDLVSMAGGVSVTRDVPTAFPTLSKETAVALNPDVIILSDSEDNREPNAVFKHSNAVKDGRVYRINADIISRPGPRLVDALEEISLKLRGGQ